MPWLAREGGYPAATTALVGIAVPLIACVFGLQAWSLCRVVGATGSGELIAKLYGSGLAGLTGAIVASTSVILLALVLTASASLVEAVSAGLITQPVALPLCALFLALSGVPAGVRAIGRLSGFHSGLVLVGAVAAVALTVVAVGGLDATLDALGRVGRTLRWGTTAGRGGGDYNVALAVSGGFGPGTTWSGTTILSVLIAVAGTLLALIWMPLTLATQDPRRFARQIPMGAAIGGGLLLAVTFALGLATLKIDQMRMAAPVAPFPGPAIADERIARIIDIVADERSWSASALLGLGAGAALHALALALLAAAVAALRALWSRRASGARNAGRNLGFSQATAAILVASALALAYLPMADLSSLAGLALAIAPLAVVPLCAACWFPKLSQRGLIVGLLAGVGVALLDARQSETAVHAASFALIVSIFVAAILSRVGRADGRFALRRDSRATLDRVFARMTDDRAPDHGADATRRTMAAIGIIVWVFFAIGPGLVIGNDLFGAPDQPRARWDFPIPSLAVWQILAWATGAGLVWFLANGLGLAAISREQIDQITSRTDPKTEDR